MSLPTDPPSLAPCSNSTVPQRRPVTAAVAGRVLAAVAVAAVAGGLTATSASAHVRVHADSTASGTFSQLTFRVPTESDTASTTKVEVTLPQDHPFLDVSTKPVPGWTATVTEQPLPTPVTVEGTTITKAARTVTWQAQAGAGIAPGEYQDFDISAGPLPAPATILLPATQTYSDGTTVTWDQPNPAGGPEPEHPSPALVVTAAPAGAVATTPPTSAAPAPADAASSASNPTSSDPLARILAVVALAVAVLGAGSAIWLRRRPTKS